ncbi:hypothetical protein [Modicisalibacter muralis]|nr:hypothetical protein [Halomonas muralis]
MPRRHFLLGVGAGSTLVLASPRQVLAACESEPETYNKIRLIVRDAIMQGIQVALQGEEILEASREARQQLETRLRKLVETQLPDVLEDYRSSQSWTLTNIPLEPLTDFPDHEPIMLGPSHFEYSPVERLPAQEPEHCGYVIISFIGDLIGLSIDGIDAFKKVCSDRGLGDTLEILLVSIVEGDFPRARAALEYFLEELNTRENLKTLREVLSPQNARRISAWFAGRCVPILGWALVLWDLVDAFIEYRERFQQCEFA